MARAEKNNHGRDNITKSHLQLQRVSEGSIKELWNESKKSKRGDYSADAVECGEFRIRSRPPKDLEAQWMKVLLLRTDEEEERTRHESWARRQYAELNFPWFCNWLKFTSFRLNR